MLFVFCRIEENLKTANSPPYLYMVVAPEIVSSIEWERISFAESISLARIATQSASVLLRMVSKP